jgi:hypothetical protein
MLIAELEKKASSSELVSAFLASCRKSRLSDKNITDLIKTAVLIAPEIAEEFASLGWKKEAVGPTTPLPPPVQPQMAPPAMPQQPAPSQAAPQTPMPGSTQPSSNQLGHPEQPHQVKSTSGMPTGLTTAGFGQALQPPGQPMQPPLPPPGMQRMAAYKPHEDVYITAIRKEAHPLLMGLATGARIAAPVAAAGVRSLLPRVGGWLGSAASRFGASWFGQHVMPHVAVMGAFEAIPAIRNTIAGPDPKQQAISAAQGSGMQLAQAASLNNQEAFNKVVGSAGQYPAVAGALQQLWNNPATRQHLANQDTASNAVYQMHQHLKTNPNLTGEQLGQVMLNQLPKTAASKKAFTLQDIASNLGEVPGRLAETWNGLDPTNKAVTGVSGGLLAAGLLQTLRDRESNTGPLMALAGAGGGLYGLSNGHPSNMLQTAKNIAVGQPRAATGQPTTSGGLSLEQAAGHPQLSKFFGAGGSPRFSDIVKAPDAELQAGIKLLAPEARMKLHQQVGSFQPGMAQSMGAKMLGIDVEGQRKRLLGLLGGAA